MPYPFDLKRALEGEAVVTWSGRAVRRVWVGNHGLVVAEFVISKPGAEIITTMTKQYEPESFLHGKSHHIGEDLMMKYPTSQRPVIKKFGEMWSCEVPYYNAGLGHTQEEAYKNFCRQFEE